MKQLPDYQDTTFMLAKLNIKLDPAEMHGLFCGFISSNNGKNAKAYLESLNKKIQDKSMDTLNSIYEITLEQMHSDDFSFEVLLPNDKEDLSLRAEALGKWCYGFLQGIQLSEVNVKDFHSEELNDALEHIEEIAKIDFEYVDATEDDEKAYTELYEYVRMATLLIQTELKQAPVVQKNNEERLH